MTIPSPYAPPSLELADILETYLPCYLKENTLPVHYHKVLRAILNCRTSALSAHAALCNECGHREISYNSCRNRHCPKCQGSVRLKWLGNRQSELLPVPYYHCVFTLPHSLNLLVRFNAKKLYRLLFLTVFATLNAFAANPKHLGGQIGFIAILHTWGQKLNQHIHLHCIVTGGGLSPDGKQWIAPKYERDFLFPVRAMSRVFMGKFIEALEEYWRQGQLNLPGKLADLHHPVVFEGFKRRLYDSSWVVYAKKPFAGPTQVLEYVGRYTHRVAISNHRLRSLNNGQVSFEYKDYRDNGKQKVETLPAMEFIRRFLDHIVPHRFVRIRYGGFLAGGFRRRNLARAHALLAETKDVAGSIESFIGAARRLFEAARRKCPVCRAGTLVFERLISADEALCLIMAPNGIRGRPVTGV